VKSVDISVAHYGSSPPPLPLLCTDSVLGAEWTVTGGEPGSRNTAEVAEGDGAAGAAATAAFCDAREAGACGKLFLVGGTLLLVRVEAAVAIAATVTGAVIAADAPC
jgi:hypothetical protein